MAQPYLEIPTTADHLAQ